MEKEKIELRLYSKIPLHCAYSVSFQEESLLAFWYQIVEEIVAENTLQIFLGLIVHGLIVNLRIKC